MTTEEEVTFRLLFFCRFDEEVKAFVAYVPRLQVYAQSPVEDDLKEAVRKVALHFIRACADRRILDNIMQESRMKELTPVEAETAVKSDDWEFVSVRGYKKCDSIELTFPLPLKFEPLMAGV